jgi:hypothetical protein
MYHTTRKQSGIKEQGLYNSLYQQIDMGGPSMDDMPSQAAPGASMANQARAAGYKDMYRNIQAMRDADYKKEVARGDMSKEFSGLAGATMKTQRDLLDQGMYKSLYPRTTPVHRPYLPRTVTNPYRSSGLGGFLGQAAEKTGPGLMVALGLLIVYFLFIRKPVDGVDAAASSEDEVDEEVFVAEELEPSAGRYYY